MSPMHFQTQKIIRHLCCLSLAGASLLGAWRASAAEAAPRSGAAVSAEQKAALRVATNNLRLLLDILPELAEKMGYVPVIYGDRNYS